MKNPLPAWTLLAALCALSFVCGGCGSKDDSGIPSGVSSEMASLGDAARKAGGDFDRLADAEKARFTERAGSEEGARAMVKQMTGSPSGPRGGAP